MASHRSLPRSKMAGNIFLFVPNVIGYVRLGLLVVACYFMIDQYRYTLLCYMLSQLLDAMDGYAARSLNQGTAFGAVLDMVTDRVSTLVLMMALGLFYPDLLVIFQLLAMLDIASHWLQMYAALLFGESGHKGSSNFFLNLYYTNRTVLFLMCAGNELFFMSLYVQFFTPGPMITLLGFEKGVWEIVCIICFPVFCLKQLISFVQLIVAAKKIASKDYERREKDNQPK